MSRMKDTHLTGGTGGTTSLQVQKCISCVTRMDHQIARLERQLQSQLGSGDLEVCHNLEMRNDEKVHTRALLREKYCFATAKWMCHLCHYAIISGRVTESTWQEEKLRRKEERGEELSKKVESTGCELDESFRHNAPIKCKYLEVSSEHLHIQNEIQKLEEEEGQLRSELNRITPVLRYLESVKVLDRKYRDVATQCFGNEFSFAMKM